MKIKKKEFHSVRYAYLPSALEQLQEFVDKLKREDVISIYEKDCPSGFSYVLFYWSDKEED